MQTSFKRNGSWRSRQQLELATLNRMHWFNHNRLTSSIGYTQQAETEEKYSTDLAIGHALKEDTILSA